MTANTTQNLASAAVGTDLEARHDTGAAAPTARTVKIPSLPGLVARRSPGVIVALAVLLIWLIVAIIGPPIFDHAAQTQDLSLRLTPPFHGGFLNFLGTDSLGRSMLARLIVGARVALLVAGIAVLVSSIVGMTLGLVSGYFAQTWVDTLLMRLADILMTFPSILLGLTILYILSPGVTSLVIVLAVTRLPVYMRVARAKTLELRERAFVDVSRGLGASKRRIIFRDLRPLVTPTIGTVAMLELATALLNAAGLSFIGVGLQPPTVDWGLMVSDGQSYLTQAWWLTVFPGVTIMLVAFCANVVSNWFRSMADPAEMAKILAPRRPSWSRRQSLTAAYADARRKSDRRGADS